jgi:hypothetical protein
MVVKEAVQTQKPQQSRSGNRNCPVEATVGGWHCSTGWDGRTEVVERVQVKRLSTWRI